MPETTNKPTLKDQVQILRDKARDVLRLQAIQRYMHKIYKLNLQLKDNPTRLEEAQKEIDRVMFKIKNLSRTDPDYETKLKDLEDKKKNCCKEYDSLKIIVTRDEKEITEAIAETEKKISQVEAGEIKISIDDANELTLKAIKKLMYV